MHTSAVTPHHESKPPHCCCDSAIAMLQVPYVRSLLSSTKVHPFFEHQRTLARSAESNERFQSATPGTRDSVAAVGRAVAGATSDPRKPSLPSRRPKQSATS